MKKKQSIKNIKIKNTKSDSNFNLLYNIQCKCNLCIFYRNKLNKIKKIDYNIENKDDLYWRNKYLSKEYNMIDFGFLLDKLYNNKKYNFSSMLINDLIYFIKGDIRYYIYYNYNTNSVNIVNKKDNLKFNEISKWIKSRKQSFKNNYLNILEFYNKTNNFNEVNFNNKFKYWIYHINNRETNFLNDKDISSLFTKISTNKIWKDIYYIWSIKEDYLNKITYNVKFRSKDPKTKKEIELYDRARIIIKIIYKIIPHCSLLYITNNQENEFLKNWLIEDKFLYFKYINYKIYSFIKKKNFYIKNFNTKWAIDENNIPWLINATIYNIKEKSELLITHIKTNKTDYEEYFINEKKKNDIKIIYNFIQNRIQKFKYQLKMYNIEINSKLIENESTIVNQIFSLNKDYLCNMLLNKSLNTKENEKFIDEKLIKYFPQNISKPNIIYKKNKKTTSVERFERIALNTKYNIKYNKNNSKPKFKTNFNINLFKTQHLENILKQSTKINYFYKLANNKNRKLLKSLGNGVTNQNTGDNFFLKIRTSSNCFKLNLNKLKIK